MVVNCTIVDINLSIALISAKINDWHNLVLKTTMELVAGYPFWLIKNGLLYSYPKLLENKKSDAVIIGGGISGALTAWHLIKAGIECTVVDSRTIGLGSTCASTSLLQYELDIPLHKLKTNIGDHKAVRAYELCGGAIDKLINIMNEIGYTGFYKRKSLFFSTHKRQQKFIYDEYLARKTAGFEVQILPASELHRNYNLKAAHGILSEKGATTDAYSLTHEILQYCIRKGLKVFDRTRIKTIDYYSDKVILKTNEGCVLEANHVVNATGYEVINFIGKKIVNLDCTYAIVSESQAEKNELWKDNIMMWNTDDPYLYMCCADENRVIVGGRDEPFINMKTMYACLDKKSSLLEKDFAGTFTGSSIKKEFAWSGVFGKTKDSLPYIGNYFKTPRTFYALGFGGNGITFSQVAAEIITDLLCGRKNKDADIFSFTR
jgi:glycine/D-amino acid oxidase-like deaminating enzyme